ncbi:MotA/TolQ/ExbB proton channel family protein [Carboxylicivirga sp. A043]|uniref:MotA/TolQ/ExbB proton channel family protein n=1 Tax=Carboxylicivirga litoralis TaxID=2816963 RepID=UPI0021CB76CD|nr:MotA/TolQ/ExbB proton channel family protein [Carboxylicivirga sp. A043]MCU4155929.1 MotA/TolQ/ExbB proton channel family protein [Carboxylicivirga sp. A043]
MIDFLVQGGILGMSVITGFGIAAIVMAILNAYYLFKGQEASQKKLNSVLYLGSLAFFAGLVWNAIGMYEILDVIQRMGSVSQSALAGGLKAASISTIYGLSLFFIAYVCWYLLRLKINN